MKIVQTGYIIFLILGLFFPANIFSQQPSGSSGINGLVKGTISDAATGEGLVAANVFLNYTGLGASTDNKGRYTIYGIPPGIHTLTVTYIGYKTIEHEIRVDSGQTLIQNVKLEFVAVEGEEVIVTAQARGQMKAINQQLSAQTISNIVSEEFIRELPDANAGESVGRLPGVSVLRDGGEGNQVAIRGLSPKYNAISIQGVRMTSTSSGDLNSGENADRSVDLNMIPSEMLAGIEVIKAPTADKDADVLGGTVDFKLRQAPEGLQSRLMAQGGYNSQQNQFNIFKFSGDVSNRFFNNKVGVYALGIYDKTNRGTDFLRVGLTEDLVNESVDLASLTLTDRLEDRVRMGGSLLLDYKLPNGIITLNTFYSRLEREITSRTTAINPNVTTSINQSELKTDLYSSTASAEYDFGPFSIDGGVSYTRTSQEIPWNASLSFLQNDAIELPGDVQFNNLRPKDVLQYYTGFGPLKPYWGGGNLQSRKVWEDELATALNFKVPYSFLGGTVSAILQFGGKYRHKTREQDITHTDLIGGPSGSASVEYRNWILDNFPGLISQNKDNRNLSGTSIKIGGFLDNDYSTGEFLGGGFELGPALSEQALKNFSGLYYDHGTIHERNSRLNDHWGSEDVYAAYVMTDVNIGSRLTIIPGIRYERFLSEYTAAQSTAGTDINVWNGKDSTASRDNDGFFPMIHLKYDLFEWMDIRAAYTETTTRPEYSWYVPFIDAPAPSDGGDVRAGNIFLEPSRSTNYDLILSVHSNKIGLFTAGVFHKKIDGLVWPITIGLSGAIREDVVEEYVIPSLYVDAGDRFVTWVNNPHPAYVSGLEFDWQTQFWYLPKPFNGLVLSANYTYISSEVEYTRKILELDPESRFPNIRYMVKDTVREGRLLNQANHIFNIGIGYDYRGFSSRLTFQFQGNTTTGIAAVPLLDRFSANHFRVDFRVSQKLPVKGLEIYGNFNNLTDAPEQSFQSTRGYITDASYYGWTAVLGIRYNFQRNSGRGFGRD